MQRGKSEDGGTQTSGEMQQGRAKRSDAWTTGWRVWGGGGGTTRLRWMVCCLGQGTEGNSRGATRYTGESWSCWDYRLG